MASLTLVLLLLPAPPAVAQQEAAPSPLAVSAQVDKAEVTIGDIVTYHLSIRHDPEIQLAIPHLEKQFDGFIFIDRETPATQKIGDQVLDEFKFRFRADKVGHYTQSEITIHFTVPDSKDSGKLIPGQAKAPKTVVVVRSVLFLDGEPTDIRDIKSIHGSAFDWRPWALAFVAIVLTGLLIIYWFRKGGKKAAPILSPSFKPHEVALQELRPEILGVSVYIWNRGQSFELIERLKKQIPELEIVIGGPEVSFETRLSDRYTTISGEGENKWVEFLQYQQRNETVPQNVLDRWNTYGVDLPELVPPYVAEDYPQLKNRIAYIETSRGCPYLCSFCLSALDKKVRYFDGNAMRKQIEELVASGPK